MKNEVDESVLERIKKLLDHHKGCLKVKSEHEAFNALELAKNLMRKHHLDMMRIEEYAGSCSDDVSSRHVDKCSVYTVPIWMCNIINVVNNICNSSCILNKDKQSNGYIHISVVFVALTSEIDHVYNMYMFLKKTMYKLANEHVRQIHGNTSNWRSFSEGFTHRLLEKSREMNEFVKENLVDSKKNCPKNASEFDDDDFEESSDEEIDLEEEKINKTMDVQLYKYISGVRKKIEKYIEEHIQDVKNENVNRKSKVVIDSYQIGRRKAESTNLTYVDKEHQLTYN